MQQPYRILHVFAALDSGGVSSFVMNLYRAMGTDRIQFDFAITAGEKALYDEEVLRRGGRIFYIDTSGSIAANLRRILREEGPFYAVHSHVYFYSGLILREAGIAGVPVRIAHAHNAYTGEPRSLPRLFYERSMQALIRRYATHMLGCSEKACRHVFGDRIMTDPRAEVLPDGIDCKRFAYDPAVRASVRQAYGIEGSYVVGHVGHFNPAKNHSKILSVFSEVCRRRDDAVLLLVGDGEGEKAVREQADSLGLTDRVIYAGAHKDVERFYQAMDVFLFPSRYEGFGMAMIEAQLSGLACVASDVVPRETNADGRAVYLPLETEDAVWGELVASAQERDTSSYERIAEQYDAARIADRMAAVYSGGI